MIHSTLDLTAITISYLIRIVKVRRRNTWCRIASLFHKYNNMTLRGWWWTLRGVPTEHINESLQSTVLGDMTIIISNWMFD